MGSRLLILNILVNLHCLLISWRFKTWWSILIRIINFHNNQVKDAQDNVKESQAFLTLILTLHAYWFKKSLGKVVYSLLLLQELTSIALDLKSVA